MSRLLSQLGRVLLGCSCLFPAMPAAAAAPLPGTWAGFGGIAQGCNGAVNAILKASDGSHVLVGQFTACGGVSAPYVVRHDFASGQWSAMGALPDTGYALTEMAGQLYAGSARGGRGQVARWDGAQWATVTQTNGPVYALAVRLGQLYAAGNFSQAQAGGIVINHIARYNGTFWESVGVGSSGANQFIRSLVVDGPNLYAGGLFTSVDNVPAGFVARWDGATWSALGTGLSGPPSALAVSSGQLFVAGGFGTAGGNAVSGIARWDGSQWSGLGSGLTGAGLSLAGEPGGAVLAGGSFTAAGGVPALNLARWDGSNWTALGAGAEGDVRALSSVDGQRLAGGSFGHAGGQPANHVARWDGQQWQPLPGSGAAQGIAGEVTALARFQGQLYAGGNFRTAGQVAVNYIARWDGQQWHPLGGGVDNAVAALASSATHLYASGQFMQAGGQPARRVARWNGAAWDPLPQAGGPAQSNNPLAVGSDRLYVANDSSVLQFDGNAWSVVGGTNGGAFNGSVLALQVVGTTLYAGGSFNSVGSVNVGAVARWNGQAWSSVGPAGQGGFVLALAAGPGVLYAGGTFDLWEGATARRVAVWDGSHWTPLGAGLEATPPFGSLVRALAVTPTGGLYAAGIFQFAGGQPASNLAHWDGQTWRTLGADSAEGIGGGGRALAVNGAQLDVGGAFGRAGNVLSSGIASWTAAELPLFASGFED